MTQAENALGKPALVKKREIHWKKQLSQAGTVCHSPRKGKAEACLWSEGWRKKLGRDGPNAPAPPVEMQTL